MEFEHISEIFQNYHLMHPKIKGEHAVNYEKYKVKNMKYK